MLSVGALHLWYPFSGDQALFALGADELRHGRHLYTDFWDNKQPGIYWFFLAARRLFGPGEFAVHAVELAWLALAAVIAVLGIRPELTHRSLAALLPLASIGLYYASAGSWHLTQVEILVSLPIVACLALLSRPYRLPGRRRLATGTAGVLIVTTALFKLLLVVIPLSFLLLCALVRRRGGERPADLALGLLLPAAIGAVISATAVLAYLYATGTLAAAYWTSFSLPPLLLAAIPGPPLARLGGSIEWFARATWPLWPFAAAGTIVALRRRTVFLLGAVAWLLLGLAVILLQRLSWWQYHFMLLMMPLGILAVAGMDWLLAGIGTWLGARPAARVAGALLCLAPLLVAVAMPAAAKLRLISNADFDAQRIQLAVDGGTRKVRQTAELVAARHPGPDAVAVFGDPRILLLLHARQATRLCGWTFYLPEQVRELAGELATLRPRLVYVGTRDYELLTYHSNAFAAVLHERYAAIARDASGGVWYELIPE